MTATDNINLNIQNGQSLSYVIDKELDKELNVDVQLGLKEWNSVFSLIKENQVESNKSRFGEKDTDINNGRHYVVQEGTYAIKGNVWQQIVDIAKKKMGLDQEEKTPDTVNQAGTETTVRDRGQVYRLGNNPLEGIISNPDTEEKLPPQEVSAEEQVSRLLNKAGINLEEEDEALQKDVVAKYNTMLTIAEQNGQTLDDETVQTRLANYIKGWKFHKFEVGALTENPAEYQSDCSNATTLDELKTAYGQFGKEYVEYTDQDGNGSIELHELFYQELIEHYQTSSGGSLSKTEAKQKATETVGKFANYNVQNFPPQDSELYNTPEMELFTLTASKLGILDTDKNSSLSSQEAASYLLTMAQMEDKKNNITPEEYIMTEMAISTPEYQEFIETKLGESQKFLFGE